MGLCCRELVKLTFLAGTFDLLSVTIINYSDLIFKFIDKTVNRKFKFGDFGIKIK